MLECEREKERIAALEGAKTNDRSDEMMRRIQLLESALQQAHEDYKILSQGWISFNSTSPDVAIAIFS